MKNNYLFLSLCFGLYSGIGMAQNTYVAGNQKVKVNPNTLFYVGGDLQINTAANAAAVVENAGNIKIQGNFINQADPNGKNFVSTWTNNNSYGQVIINDASTNVQALTMEKGKINPSAFSWGQFAIPFNFTTANDAMQALFGVPYSNGSGRYYASMMVWDNVGKPQFKHLTDASTMKPTDYIILNLTYNSAGIKPIMTGGGKLAYSGLPTNTRTGNLTMDASIYYPGVDWAVWKEYKNDYNEKYRTYITDEVRRAESNSEYGRNHFQFGNPYTSNLDLSKLSTIPNLLGVSQISSTYWVTGSESETTSSSVKATYGGGSWVGDPEALIVKPFEPFVVVLDSDATSTVTFEFGDEVKTFSMTPSAPVTPVPAPKMEGNTSYADTETDKNYYTGASLVASIKGFYQLGLSLYDEDGNATGNKAFVVVSNSVNNGVEHRWEAEYSDFGSRSGFYLAQENPDGSQVSSSSRKMYINAVGMTYNNKPIPFFFNRKNGDTKGYYIKADLYKDNIFNKLTSEDRNYADGNSFYFYDYKADELLMITTDFNFYVRPSTTPLENRFQIYWNGRLTNKDGVEVSEDISTTIVYKDKDTHKVKFNEEWDSAEVKVYDMTGRKVLEFFNVNTKNNFEIKLPTNGVYVVKVVSNTGDVYTQKIIK